MPLLIKFIGDFGPPTFFGKVSPRTSHTSMPQVLDSYASFPAIDVNELSLKLFDFYHNCRAAEQAIRPKPVLDRYVKMFGVPSDVVDRKMGFMAMPPLLKG